MKAALILEDFSPVAPGSGADGAMGHTEQAPDPAQDADQLAAYDRGYSAGWDDGQAAITQSQGHIDAEFSRTLQELSFTYHEARLQAELSLKPLVEALVQTILPGLQHKAFAQQVFDLLDPIAKSASAPLVTLRCAPDNEATLNDLLRDRCTMPVELVPEPSLLPGQATFILGHETHHIDVAGLQHQLTDLLDEHLRTVSIAPEEKVLSHAG